MMMLNSTVYDDDIIPLRVTVTWYDPPSVGGSTVRALLQNLDLLVTSPSGVKYAI